MNIILNYGFESIDFTKSIAVADKIHPYGNKLSKCAMRLAKKLLQWTDCQETISETSVKQIRIDEQKLTDLILSSVNQVYRRQGKPPTYVIIGYSQMSKLIGEVAPYMTSFQIDLKTQPRIFGLKIILNPFIDGIVPLIDNI